MKALGIVAAAAMAFAPLCVVATTPQVAQGAPCVGAGSNPTFCEECLFWLVRYGISTSRSCYEAAPPRPAPAPVSRMPLPTAAAPPEPPSMAPVPTPQVVLPGPPQPTTIPVQIPKINPPASGAPRTASLVTPPKELDAPPPAVAAAKAAPATRINPAAPPKSPTQVDFDHQAHNLISAHGGNVDVVKAGKQALLRPRHWDYLDYDDDYHRPSLYNPLDQAMTFRYLYNGAYREVYVPAGGRIVLDADTAGLFPFTAVGDSYLASGSFYGGAWMPPDGWAGPPPPNYTPPSPPPVYQDVTADVPAGNQTVEVGQVQVVAHDDSRPAGSQDTFLLDDSTLAWGQVNEPTSSTQIRVTKTQPLPGVGPTDDGSFLVALAAHQESAQPAPPWWPSALGYGVLAVAVGLVAWRLSVKYGALS
jgi:hypothetical protein